MMEVIEMMLISRVEAARIGLNRYFTGKPCCRGHVCERYVSDNKCVICAGAGKNKGATIYNPCRQSERFKAIASGVMTYKSNRLCKFGHRSERYTANGSCVECMR